jgi:hypothetical protein
MTGNIHKFQLKLIKTNYTFVHKIIYLLQKHTAFCLQNYESCDVVIDHMQCQNVASKHWKDPNVNHKEVSKIFRFKL